MNRKHLHLTKGVHLVFPSEKLPIQQSVYFDVSDGRMIFGIPRGRVTYVGTTDTNYSGSLDRVVATKADANYLLDAVNHMFPDINLTEADIESNWAGLRPLIHEEDKDPSQLSRKDEIFVSESGLISIAGGKLTGYRKMAQRVMETVLKTMKPKKREKYKKSTTTEIALTSQPLKSSKEVKMYEAELKERFSDLGITDPYYAWYFVSTYGRQTETILRKLNYFANEEVLERLKRAELWYCVQFEMTNSLTDFFVRRTGSLYFNIESVQSYVELVLADIAEYLDWNTARIEKERVELDVLVKDAKTYYDKEFE